MKAFKKGQVVSFAHEGRRVVGRVIRVNKKTVSVQPLSDTEGRYFRVPPSLLQPADEAAAALSAARGPATLRVTQSQLMACLADERTPDATARLSRIGAVFGNPQGRLSVVASGQDIETGDIRGWEAVAILMEAAGAAPRTAGRLALELDCDDPRPLREVPEVRTWSLALVRRMPWLPAWVPFDAGGFHLLDALAPFTLRQGQPMVQQAQAEAATWSANHAAAFLRQLGEEDLAPAQRLMETVLGQRVPPGFFDGIENTTQPMDATGRTDD